MQSSLWSVSPPGTKGNWEMTWATWSAVYSICAISTLTALLPEQVLKEDLEKNLQGRWIEVLEKVLGFYQGYQFHQALDEIIGFVRSDKQICG